MFSERQFILRGFGAGGFAGLCAFVFSRIFAEPVVQKAIDYESGRDAAQDALDRARGLKVPAADPDIFTRGVQRNIGIGSGLVLFGLALGGIFAVTYVLAARRWPHLRPRTLAMAVAGFLFLAVFAVPFLKYPANPPAIGHEETIGSRSGLYVVMVVVSLAAMAGAIALRPRLVGAVGGWNSALLCGVAYAVVVGVAMLVLTPLGHLHANVVEYGRHATETPLPLRDGAGHIVYPGFPADTLFRFRLYSVLDQMVLWSAIGLAFGALVERMYARAGAPVRTRGAVAAA